MTQADMLSMREPTADAGSEEGFEKELIPETPAARSACVDLIDLGMLPHFNKPGVLQHKIRVVWETELRKKNGRPFCVSRKFTFSLGEKSAFRPFLLKWVGADWKHEFTTELILWRPALLAITHEPVFGKPGEVYPKVQLAYPDKSGNPYVPITGEFAYKRYVADDDAKKQPAPTPADDEVPF